MNRIVCTIVTPDFLTQAAALMLSIRALGASCRYVILATEPVPTTLEGAEILTPDVLCDPDGLVASITAKYGENLDHLRWSLKGAFIRHLVSMNPDCCVLYCDCDLCFFAWPDYIFQCLDAGGIVLTPHWRPLDPVNASEEFRLNFLDGLFNAGCIAANRAGSAALTWWSEACLAACESNYQKGLYHDQRYLDLLPIYFPETVICRHQGINIADWNNHLRKRDQSGIAPVPDRWPVTLVHFTAHTIERIRRGDDLPLVPFLQRYEELLCLASALVQTDA
jgi:hypothetical protein